MHEIEKISPLAENQMPYRVSAQIAQQQLNFQNRDYSSQALESMYRFFLGSIAGGKFHVEASIHFKSKLSQLYFSI